MLHFDDFKRGPGGALCRNLGLDIDQVGTWTDLRRAAVDLNEAAPQGGSYVAKAREIAGVLSSGERALLCAILHATDFSHVADDLARGKAWERLESASGRHRLAVAACLAQLEGGTTCA